jgi:hypothetical protein
VSAGACPPVAEGRRIRDPEASASGSCPLGPRRTPKSISRTSAARSRRSRTALRSEERSSKPTRAERSVPKPTRWSGWRRTETSQWIRNRDGSGTGPCDQNIRLRRHRRGDATRGSHPDLERNPSRPIGEIRGGGGTGCLRRKRPAGRNGPFVHKGDPVQGACCPPAQGYLT